MIPMNILNQITRDKVLEDNDIVYKTIAKSAITDDSSISENIEDCNLAMIICKRDGLDNDDVWYRYCRFHDLLYYLIGRQMVLDVS